VYVPDLFRTGIEAPNMATDQRQAMHARYNALMRTIEDALDEATAVLIKIDLEADRRRAAEALWYLADKCADIAEECDPLFAGRVDVCTANGQRELGSLT